MTATAQKGYRGFGMEGSVARWYEKTVRKELPAVRRIAEQLSALLPEGGDVLEVAPGPGFLSVELARDPRMHVTGLDISKTLVGIARKNAAEERVRVNFLEGNASELPFDRNSFDLVVCRAAFKNFSKPERALCEMHRVLRPGGAGIIYDLRRDAPMTDIKRYVAGMQLGRWRGFCTEQIFRFLLLRRAYTMPQLSSMLEEIGFKHTDVQPDEIGMEASFVK